MKNILADRRVESPLATSKPVSETILEKARRLMAERQFANRPVNRHLRKVSENKLAKEMKDF